MVMHNIRQGLVSWVHNAIHEREVHSQPLHRGSPIVNIELKQAPSSLMGRKIAAINVLTDLVDVVRMPMGI
jgi:hypothetical protein